MYVRSDIVRPGQLLFLTDMERLLQKGRMKRRKKEKKNFSTATLSDLQQSKRAHLIAPNVSSVYAALLVPR